MAPASQDREKALDLALAQIDKNYGKGSVIEGLDEAAKVEGVEIFHAGTAMKDGRTEPLWTPATT